MKYLVLEQGNKRVTINLDQPVKVRLGETDEAGLEWEEAYVKTGTHEVGYKSAPTHVGDQVNKLVPTGQHTVHLIIDGKAEMV